MRTGRSGQAYRTVISLIAIVSTNNAGILKDFCPIGSRVADRIIPKSIR